MFTRPASRLIGIAFLAVSPLTAWASPSDGPGFVAAGTGPADHKTIERLRNSIFGYAEGGTCYPDLPAPELAVKYVELYLAGANLNARYRLTVNNRADFPDEMFVESPQLPPCGANPNASRTWVDVYADSGSFLGGFCVLSSAEDLDIISFSLPATSPPPADVFITLNDRLCGQIYTSNLAPTAVDADADGLLDLQDNCTFVANADQRDTDTDQIGNVCDPDLNNDCVVDFLDLSLLKAVFFTADPDADMNGDSSVNFLDLQLMKDRFFLAPGPSGLFNACVL